MFGDKIFAKIPQAADSSMPLQRAAPIVWQDT